MNLYEMTQAATQLYDLFTAGEIPEEAVADTLEGLGVEGKLEDYCIVINQLGADVLMLKAEEEKLKEKQYRAEKGIERMKNAVKAYLVATNQEKAKAGVFSLSFIKSQSVVIKDEMAIPNAFLKEKITVSVDKTAIKNAIKSGQTVAGAELQTNKNLQIK